MAQEPRASEPLPPSTLAAVGASSSSSSSADHHDRRPSGRPGRPDFKSMRDTFGYVPPTREDPWAPSLTTNNGKVVAQEGKIVPVTSKGVAGTFRPPGMRVTGEKRTGEAGGFREFDDAEAERRKERALEVKAETKERKAEKKKCEYWCAAAHHPSVARCPA